MEESQEILLNSLQNSGVSIPPEVSSIRDLTPPTLVSICAQSLNLIDRTASFPTSLPDSMPQQFKICTDMASAIQNLGFIGDMSFHKKIEVAVGDLTIYGEDTRKDESASTERSKGLIEEPGNLRNDASENEASGNDKHISLFEQKVTSVEEQSSKIKLGIKTLRDQEKVCMEEEAAKASEMQHLELELGLWKEAGAMPFDDQHPIDFYIECLNEQVDARKHSIVELESQWNTSRKALEEKKKSLKESLYSTVPGSQEKLQNLKQAELEIQSILSEIRKRDEEYAKLSADLKKQPEVSSRRPYIQRITEITKNSRKQDADIERILKETRELQLESNSIQERLHRSHAVLDEIVFREAKKDSVGRQAYRVLTSIHESFEQISEKILATDRIRREVAEHEKKLTTMASWSLNFDKLQADLDSIRKENEYLEQQQQGCRS